MTLRSLDYLPSALLMLARDLVERGGAAGQSPVALAAPFSNMAQEDWVAAVRLWNEHGRGGLSRLDPRDCPACGAGARRHLFESYDGYPYAECDACGCWYVPLRVEESLFVDFFARCAEARDLAARMIASRRSEEYATACHEKFGAHLDAIRPLWAGAGPAAYLDLGCGIGHSLKAGADRGLAATGVEASAECVRIGRELGHDLRDASQGLPPGPFRVVSFWESLEHMADPAGALAACRAVLEPGGVVAFTVPNLVSPLLRLQRGDCSIIHGGYDTPGHINLFGPEQVRRLLERSGYELLDLDGLYGMNLLELASHALGLNRGASDILAGGGGGRGLDEAASAVIGSIGPAVTLIERVALLSPELFGVACPSGEAARHGDAVRRMRAARRDALLAQIEAAAGPVAQADALRRELAETRERLDEVERQTAVYRALVRALRNPGAALRRLLGSP